MSVDCRAVPAQLKKSKVLPHQNPQQNDWNILKEGTAGAHHPFLIANSSFLIILYILASHVFSPHGEDLLYKINALRAGRAEG